MLATALESHGHLRTLLLQGVSVPDRTLATILGSALTVPCLTDLDISKNDIGLEVPSLAANALATLIQSSSGKRAPQAPFPIGSNIRRRRTGSSTATNRPPGHRLMPGCRAAPEMRSTRRTSGRKLLPGTSSAAGCRRL